MHDAGPTLRFGAFEVDLRSGELRKSGVRIKLQDQPFKVLAILLERPGQLVTREELQQRIWPDENFGDFDHAVNVAVAKLRVALGDSSDNPRYVETLPRRGYRFSATTEIVDGAAQQSPKGRYPSAPEREEELHRPRQPDSVPATAVRQHLLKKVWQPWYGLVILAVCVAAVFLFWRRSSGSREPEFRRVSFGRGYVHTARFTPDGQNVVYGAAWDGKPFQLFWNRVDGTDSRPLSALDLDILSISPKGEMAVLLNRKFSTGLESEGTLALMQVTGSAPRPVLDHVQDADWSRDGTKLAVTHNLGDQWQLEFPVGTVIYQLAGPWMSRPRISPKGNLIAFLEHPLPGDDAGYVVVVDLAGNKKRLTGDFGSVEGLAWDRSGEEIWFAGDQIGVGGGRSLFKVTLAGKQRLVRRETTHLTVHDISSDGSLLVTRSTYRSNAFGRIYPEEEEREIGWLDLSFATYLSNDATTVVLGIMGEAAGRGYEIYIRSTKPGSAALRLGEGVPFSLSPDGKWVLSDFPWGLQASSPPQLVLLPTGTGQPVKVTNDSIVHSCGTWLTDGRILFTGNEPGHKMRTWVQDRKGGSPQPITPEGTTGLQVSPDNFLVALDAHDTYWLYPIAGGKPGPLKGFQPGDDPIGWSADGRSVFVARYGTAVSEVYRIKVANGDRQLIRKITPRDHTGSFAIALFC